MPHGRLLDEQKAAILPHIAGKIVHDLGCGDMELAQWLVRSGAEQVIAIDRHQPMNFREPTQVKVVVSHFEDYHEPVETVFASWPINWQELGLLRMVSEAKRVIYLGSNLDGNACGFREMFEHLIEREILAHVPGRQNTLIIYGDRPVVREPVPEEFAALNQERIYSFREAYASSSL